MLVVVGALTLRRHLNQKNKQQRAKMCQAKPAAEPQKTKN